MSHAKRGFGEFGKRLRSLREAAGLTQAALGKALGIHPVSLSQYESAVSVPRDERKAEILAYFEKDVASAKAPDPPKKKRGRPRKTDLDRLPGLVKRGRPKKVAEAIVQKVVVPSTVKTEPRGCQSEGAAIKKSPARLGQVSRSWLEQQADSFIHSRGLTLVDGQVRVVTMRRGDIIELMKTALEACGTMVLAEVGDD